VRSETLRQLSLRANAAAGQNPGVKRPFAARVGGGGASLASSASDLPDADGNWVWRVTEQRTAQPPAGEGWRVVGGAGGAGVLGAVWDAEPPQGRQRDAPRHDRQSPRTTDTTRKRPDHLTTCGWMRQKSPVPTVSPGFKCLRGDPVEFADGGQSPRRVAGVPGYRSRCERVGDPGCPTTTHGLA